MEKFKIPVLPSGLEHVKCVREMRCLVCDEQGEPKYQIPITEIKMIEYKKNQNIK